MWCSPTRRSFITGRYIVHITGEQAATDTNLTPLQFTILSEKLVRVLHRARHEVLAWLCSYPREWKL